MNKNYQKIKGFIIPLLFILTSIIFYSCSGKSGSSEEVSSGTPVGIIHPVKMNFADYLDLNANTIFLSKEIVRASFQGFIEKVYKNIGDRVRTGDKLFSIKTREYAASDSLKIEIGEEIFNGTIYIKAKSSGVLSDLNYHAGDFISDGEQLAVISNPSSLRIKLNVPFENTDNIRIGGSCLVDLPNGTELTGVIEKSIPSVDPGTQTQTYLIIPSRGKELPENLNVMVKIPVKISKDAIVLPKGSIMSDVTEREFWVMRLINDTTAVKVDIKRGIESDSLVQVLSPLFNTSDRIVNTGAYGLPDSAKVEIIK